MEGGSPRGLPRKLDRLRRAAERGAGAQAREQLSDALACRFERASHAFERGRFDAVVEISGGSAAGRIPLRFTGVAVETTAAAVVVRPIARGDVLRESDIAIERRPRTEVLSDAVRDPQGAIGLAARHTIKAGQVIRRTDLAKPELVHRNEPVIIVFEQPGLMLTLRGKALDSGAEGDTVHVLNLQSKKTLQAVVSGSNRVIVVSTTPRATTNIASISHPQRP